MQCDEKSGLAKYIGMFENTLLKNSGRKIFQFLDNIFTMIDADRDGHISKFEGKKAIRKNRFKNN